ncbi:MAG: SBBP repeat-containing protein, partial [Ignavibacteriae bacterium]|nr:SBBP repeat-containing protein [Ignavibacteriota bacterium]
MKRHLLRFIYSISALIFLCSGSSFSQPTIEWVQRYSDYATKNKRVVDTKLDKAGNVYIAGYIENNDTSRIFLTLKYNSSGNFQWARTYNCMGGWDYPVGLCVDTLGNVYVAGRSDTSTSIYHSSTSFLTIKYSGKGDILWMRRFINQDSLYALPRAICLDDSMNVYVVGYCHYFTSNGISAIIKYNKNGETAWIKYYPNSADRFVDYYSIEYKNRFIYLTGIGYGNTLKISTQGEFMWSVDFLYWGKKILVDDSNYVYVGGIKKVNDDPPLYGISASKYDTSGTLLWSKYWIETNWYNQSSGFMDMAIDKRGNLFVSGYGGQDAPYGYCYVTIKFNSLGDSVWTRIYHHAYHSSDIPSSISTDKYGNVYVTGKSDSAFLNYKMTTLKYDSLGNRKWTARYPVEFTFASSEGKFIKLDSTGNMYITGEGNGSSSGLDIIVLKYSTTTGINNNTDL